MMREGKNWHIDDDGILFIGKDFQRGQGFLPWFNDADSVTALVLEEGIEVLPVPVTGYSDFTEDLCSSCFRRFRS